MFVLLDVRLVMLIFHSSFHMLTVLTLLQFFLLSFLLSDLALFEMILVGVGLEVDDSVG